MDPTLYANSRATAQIINKQDKIYKIVLCKGDDSIYVDKEKIETNHGNLIFKNVLIVLEIKKTLIYVGQLNLDNLYSINFNANVFIIKDRHSKILAKIFKKKKKMGIVYHGRGKS